MDITSYVKVEAHMLERACEVYLTARKEKIKAKIQREIESAMLKDRSTWYSKLFKKPKYWTREQATEWVHSQGSYDNFWKLSIVDAINKSGEKWAERVELMLKASRNSADKTILLSIEDNELVHKYYD